MINHEAPLDERKERILREIVEAYVQMGEPVGSKAIAAGRDLDVSSATVRNEMAILEREGYIAQPHPSAGRIPTDKGYRYYVDRLAPAVDADPQERREIERSMAGALSALDDLLMRASHLLSDLTNYTSLASAPPVSEARLRHVELVPLGHRRIFLVIVGDGAWHAERVLELAQEPAEDTLRRSGEVANRLAHGLGLTEAAAALDKAEGLDRETSRVLKATALALRTVASDRGGRVFTGGTSRLVVWEPAPTARRVLEMLEEGEMEPLLPEPAPEGVSVRIGRELAFEDYHDLSLIAAGYRFGRQAGTLGVLGPTRMHYPSVMCTVAEVARSLSRALSRLEQ
ncbi:MAG TPA: heat-inducible transcriptional repressor HrcA [Actinomycetota bacterium]|nr:heat-inducible transcriptional repressor HrcA [Actinomycetota bacterium]